MLGGTMALEKELAVYERELERLLADEGRFVLIFEDQILGIFDTYEDALQKGYEKAGIKPFLVKKIESTESIHFFSRDIGTECPTTEGQ